MSLRLPLFPLGVVLFPGALLPLHIFEPRYRRLLADCLAGDGRFGLLQPGIGRESPPVGAVGCTADIRGTQELADGRSNIVVEGGTRFLLTRYVESDAPYLVAMVEPFDDRPGTGVPASRLELLAEEFRRYDTARRALHEVESDPRPLPTDETPLSFHVAEGLDLELAEEQRLLELRSTKERIDRLLELLPARRAEAEAGLVVHQRAGHNGKGHRRPGLTEGV
jgi:Lon protease-like protein